MNKKFILYRPGQIVSGPPVEDHPLRGKEMNSLTVIEGKSIQILDGKISSLIDNSEASKQISSGVEFLDCSGKVLLPGLIDSHTHILYAGERREEFFQRLEGKSYSEILQSGNGIYRTVKATRKATLDQLLAETGRRISKAILNGTTTMEVKTGYGLSASSEIKMMEAIRGLKETSGLAVRGTFLAAHAIPEGMAENQYVDAICSEMIPSIPPWMEYVDVFCDKGAFGIESTRRIFQAAMEKGLGIRLHSDELQCIGCTGIVEEFPVKSVDHLIRSGKREMEMISRTGTIATLLPTTAFSLNRNLMPDVSRFVENGIAFAIATDSSPNVPNTDLLESIYLAVTACNTTVEQAINAVTINAAHSLDFSGIKGALAEGYDADVCVLDIEDYRDVVYRHGNRMVSDLIIDGKVAVRNFSPEEPINSKS